MKIIKNYIYNVLYQILVLILPIVTVPYVSRVLGAEGIGINSFTGSIVQYFVFLGTLGITLYGNREIAYVRNDKSKMSKVFWEVTALKFILLTVALIVYIAILFFFNFNNKIIFLIQAINILSVMIDSSWFFMGLENFKVIVGRNTLVKIISVILIFLMVKTPNDVWIYTLIINLSNFLGLATIWAYVPSNVVFVKVKIRDLVKHIKPSSKLFIPQLATYIYTVLDKTVLGVLSSNYEVGLYDNSQKIIKMVLSLVTSMGMVMLPRISNLYNEKKFDQINSYIIKTFQFATYLAVPMVFGIISISDNFAICFFGREFSQVGILMSIASPLILFVAWGSVTGVQYMLPLGKEKQYSASVISGAAINFIINLVLIPKYKALGACIGMVSAEFTVTFMQIIFLRNVLPLRLMYEDFGKTIISGLIMMFFVKSIKFFMLKGMILITVQVFGGVIIYLISQLILKVKINRIILDKLLSIKILKSITSKAY